MNRDRSLRSTGIQVWLAQAALTVGAILGVASVVLAVGTVFFGVQPLVFRSGSMSPTIDTGALALSRDIPASEIRIGDIVSVHDPKGVRVTHRVVGVDKLATPEGGVSLRLKGDANQAADADAYVAMSADRVFAHVPYLGYFAAWMSGPLGMFVAGLLVAGLIAYLVLRRRSAGPPGGRRKAAATAFVVGLSGIGAVSAGSSAQGTAAAWNDTASVASQNFATHTVVRPATLTCNGGGLLADLKYTFPNTDLRYRYVVTLENTAGTVMKTDVIANSGSVLTPQSITYNFLLLNGFVGVPATITVRVRARLSSAPAWVSAGSTTQTGKLLSLGILGLGSSCT